MNLQYCSKKWEKEVKKYMKFTSVDTYDKWINNTINDYLNPVDPPDFRYPPIKDIVSFYYLLGDVYRSVFICEYLMNNIDESFNYMYLSAESHIKSFDLAKEGVKITNQAIEIAINDTTELEDIIYSAISVNEYELAQKHSERYPIIDCILKGDYDKAKKFVLELPDEVDESREVYYVHDKFLKQIYLALLNKDEVLFNQELIKRIKKYRRNMVGYSTYIDVVSISMIKFARKLGMDYNFDIIEIPKYFLDENVQADKEKYKLPEI